MKYGRLTEFVLKHVDGKVENIKDFRFWYQLETYEPMGFSLPLSVNTGNFKMMLCRFSVDEPDKIYLLGKGEDDFKAHIIPVDENFISSSRMTYADDILSYFERGYALPYEEGDYLKENLKLIKPIGGGFTEVYYGDILFNKDGEIRWTSFPEDFEEEENNND